MSRKILALFLAVIAVAVGIGYSMVQNGQTAQPSTNTLNCKPENLAGNFTSSPEINDTSASSYNVTFYVQNLAPQSTTIKEFTDNHGMTQAVDWTVSPSTIASFTATINTPENSLILKTSCGTLLTIQVYYPPPILDQVKHYEVSLYLSVGGAAQ